MPYHSSAPVPGIDNRRLLQSDRRRLKSGDKRVVDRRKPLDPTTYDRRETLARVHNPGNRGVAKLDTSVSALRRGNHTEPLVGGDCIEGFRQGHDPGREQEIVEPQVETSGISPGEEARTSHADIDEALQREPQPHRQHDCEADRQRDAVETQTFHSTAPAWMTGAANRYPQLRTVLMIAGSWGSSSIRRRSRLMWTSMLRSRDSVVRPRAMSSSWSRDSTRCGRSTSASRISNSAALRFTSAPTGEYSRRRATSRRQPRNSNTCLAPGGAPGSGAAAQHGAGASEQLARTERLYDIVVGPHFEADDAVGFVIPRGQHDDRQPAAGTQLLAEHEAVPPRQHDVEDDQIDPGVAEDLHHRVAVGRDRNAVAMVPEELRQKVADLFIVIDDQEVCGRGIHTRSIALRLRVR